MNFCRRNLVNIPSHALQSEGAEAITGTLIEHGLNGVVLFPAYYTEINENGRWCVPPLLSSFEKPVFGKRSCRIERRSPFPHKESYYNNTKVIPVKYKGAEDIWTPFIKHCKSLGLDVILAMVPLVSFDDVDRFVPQYYDGSPFEEYLGFLCPNNPDVMNFAIDSVRELTERYADLCDALLLDHIEYPAYSLKEIFTCFCPYCKEKAEKSGIDVQAAIREIEGIFSKLENLLLRTDTELSDIFSTGLADGINIGLHYPNLLKYLQFKVKTISNAHLKIASEVRKAAGKKLLGNGAFAPTYSLFTGVDYKLLETCYDFICPKLYSQHWTKMLNKTRRELNELNSNISTEKMLKAFMRFTGIPSRSYIDEKLNISSKLVEKELEKIALSNSGNNIPWIHCEGPANELEIKLELLAKHGVKSAFFHEYMFLGPEKLNLIKNFTQES